MGELQDGEHSWVHLPFLFLCDLVGFGNLVNGRDLANVIEVVFINDPSTLDKQLDSVHNLNFFALNVKSGEVSSALRHILEHVLIPILLHGVISQPPSLSVMEHISNAHQLDATLSRLVRLTVAF